MIDFIINNWEILLVSLIGIAEIIVRITPSDKDNSVVNIIKKIIDAIVVNNKKSGGVH